MTNGSAASSDRSTALRRGVLFLVATSPIWLIPKRFPVFHPVAMLGVVLGATLLFLWWDKRSPSELGLELSWRPPVYLLGGLLGGALLIGVIAVLLHAVLPFEWTYNPAFLWKLGAASLLYLIIANGVEELLFRGYAFERLITSIGLWPAQLIIALLFAPYHLLNGYTWQVAFTGSVIGSVMFGLVFVRTRSVIAATGFHAATNWARDLLLADPPTMKTSTASRFARARCCTGRSAGATGSCLLATLEPIAEARSGRWRSRDLERSDARAVGFTRRRGGN